MSGFTVGMSAAAAHRPQRPTASSIWANRLIGGDDDPIIPLANPRLQAKLIPRSTLHVYHGGHLGILTEAHELAPLIDTFLNDKSPEGTTRD